MKKLLLTTILLILAVSVFGQKPKSKEDAFREIVALTNTPKPEDKGKAYLLAKDFMTRFGKDTDAQVTKIKGFVDKYRENVFFDAVDAHKYSDIFSNGREILAEQPDNIDVLMNLAYAGYNSMGASHDKTYIDESLTYAKKALQLIDSGAAPKSYAPFKDKPEATAFMYFVEGNMALDKDMKGAVSNIYQATLIESSIKNSALPYYTIAWYYEDIYAKLSTELKAKVDAKKISDADFKIESERVGKVIDLMMDAYARTVTRGEAEKNPETDGWKQRLAQVYKFRKKTDAGLAEYIAAVNATPMPDPSKF